MRSLRVVLFSVVSMLFVVNLHAQTVDDIINKHIDAMGGKDKIAAIKTVYTEYDVDIMGNTAAGVTYLVNGKAFRNEVDFAGHKIIECVTDKGGWGINPMQGQATPEAMPADQAKMRMGQLDAGGPLFNYASKGNKVELLGKDSLNGKSAYKLKVLTKDSSENTFWIDGSTYYVIKSVTKATVNGEHVETSIQFSNYKKTDYGYVIPVNYEVTLPQGFALNITSKKTEINKDIDMKLFEMQK
jgi:hypothetical protein